MRSGQRFDEYMAKRGITEADVRAACAALAKMDIRDFNGKPVDFSIAPR